MNLAPLDSAITYFQSIGMHSRVDALVALRSQIVLKSAVPPDEEREASVTAIRDFIKRTTHWQEGRPDKHDALGALCMLEDQIEWVEKGIVEWRDEALTALKTIARQRAWKCNGCNVWWLKIAGDTCPQCEWSTQDLREMKLLGDVEVIIGADGEIES